MSTSENRQLLLRSFVSLCSSSHLFISYLMIINMAAENLTSNQWIQLSNSLFLLGIQLTNKLTSSNQSKVNKRKSLIAESLSPNNNNSWVCLPRFGHPKKEADELSSNLFVGNCKPTVGIFYI